MGKLPVFFNPEENLLSGKSRSSYEPLMNHLRDIIERNAYIELLECLSDGTDSSDDYSESDEDSESD